MWNLIDEKLIMYIICIYEIKQSKTYNRNNVYFYIKFLNFTDIPVLNKGLAHGCLKLYYGYV